MKQAREEFFQDLADFFADLKNLFDRRTLARACAGSWEDLRRDTYRKVPLLLTILFHLGVLLTAIAAPHFIGPRSPRIPEVYTVNLYSAPEAAAPTKPAPETVKVATPAPKKIVAPKPVTQPAAPEVTKEVSLSPIRQILEKEMKEKEAQKRKEELRLRQMEQLKMELLKDQAEKEAAEAEQEAAEAEQALAEAKRAAAAKVAELYRTSDRVGDSGDSVGDAEGATGKGEGDIRELEALDRYRARLFEHISPHWQLPELQEWDDDLRAIIVMNVNRDGSVNNFYFEKRSGDSRFDQYARKAIENAQPLPPFPIDFNEKSEEIAVTFSPGGLL